MPADIRNFFGGGGPIPAAPANGQNSTNITKLAKKQRGRRVVDDSEDEEVEPKPPKSMQSRKTVKKEIVEPKVEETTSTEYFASNGKSRPSRLTPSRPKSEQPKTAASSYTESPAKGKRPVVSRGSTGRRAARPPSKNYADAESDEVAPLLEDDGDSGEELYAGDIKRNGRTDDDDYDEGSEDDLKLKAKTTNGLNGHPIKQEKKNLEPRGGVLDMADVPSLDGTRDEWPKRGTAPPKAKPGRKRKSKELEQDDDNDFVEEEDDAPKKKSRKPSEKPVAKKPRTSAKNEELDESKGIQAILDTIPTVRAPTPPPRDETKKFNFAQYQNSAAPPPLAGTREMPTGAENCLAGLTFVFTGVLESISREEGQALVKRYGGKTTAGPSSRTSYVVLGNDAGPKKLETIAKLQLKTINEEGLFELIKRLPANGGDSKAAEKHAEKKAKEEQAIRQAAAEMEKEESRATKVMTAQGKTTIPVASPTNKSAPAASSFEATVDSRLWTEKYAPLNIRSVIGNKTLIEKLQRWLRNWHRNAKYGFKQAGSDGVGIYRAAMLHGPPGIGKTTAAHLVAKLEGYDLVESNASDTRSKKLVETGLRGVLDTTSLLGYFAGDRKKVEASKRKLVLIMDEVDGMSAGDRGGVGALAAIAKKTSIPMILICNERRLPKMRPFDHVTADFPFRRPTTDQIRARIMTICFREKIKLPPPILDALIEGSHADIRQIINMISTVKLDDQAMDFDDGKAMSKAWEKHIILKPWDIVGKILSSQMFAPSSKATLNDKIELYFNDHEFSYLMLQENYLKTQPAGAASYQGRERNLKLLEMADKAAGSISDGDLVDRMIHGAQQQWSLMPTHAVFSFVRPASYVYGNFTERPGFVSWLGQNSKYGKSSSPLFASQALTQSRQA